MRVRRQPLIRRRYADEAKCFDSARPGIGLRHLVVGPYGLDHLGLDRQNRVERHHRVLEDHGNFLAPDGAHLLGRAPDKVPALEQDFAASHAPRRVDQPEDGETGDRLARAGLADKSQNLAAADLEGHAVDRLGDTVAGEEMGGEVFDLERHLSAPTDGG